MPPRRRRASPAARLAQGLPPLPPRTDPETVEIWRHRIARGEQVRTEWERDQRVEEGERCFLGQQAGGGRVFNHFAATIKTTRPNLFFAIPKFFIRPTGGRTEPVAERRAAAAEGVLEAIAHQDDHLELAGNLAVLQAYFRLGVLKVCYDPRMEPNPGAGRLIMQTRGGEPRLDELGEPMPEVDPMTGVALREPDRVLTDEVYRWQWVDAATLLLPDEGPDRTRWTWIGEEVTVPLAEAQADLRFPKELRDRLRANRTRTELDVRRRLRPAPEGEALIRYVECYDRVEKRWYVWADGQSFHDFLVDAPVPPWIDNDPYALLLLGEPILGPEPSPWPVPPVKDWIDVQAEYNIRRRQMTEGAKRSARKVFYDEGTFPNEDEAVKALQSSADMEAVRVSDLTRIPKIQEDPPLPDAIYRDLPVLTMDWRIITGQTGARLSNPEADTATEAAFVERAAGLRDAEMQKVIYRWMAEAGRKMLQCLKDTLTLRLWIALREISDKELVGYAQRVYGMEPEMLAMYPALKDGLRTRFGQQKWQPVTREALQFESDVSVVPGSTRPRNLESERRSWMEFLKVLGAAPQLALSRELLRYTAQKFEIEDERLLDELAALAQKMVQINATQAGRDAGGGAAAAGNGQAGLAPGLQALIAGARQGAPP